MTQKSALKKLPQQSFSRGSFNHPRVTGQALPFPPQPFWSSLLLFLPILHPWVLEQEGTLQGRSHPAPPEEPTPKLFYP